MQQKFTRFTQRFRKKHQARLGLVKNIHRHPIMVPILAFVILSITSAITILFINHGSTRFQPNNSVIVIVSHDHVQETFPVRPTTVGALLTKLHIRLNTGDVVEPGSATPVNQDYFRINVYRAVPVEIIVGSQKTYTFSAATTSLAVAQQANITVHPEDIINAVPVENFASQSSISKQIIINLATPVDLNLYGTPLVVRTHTATVGALLTDKHIVLSNTDSVQPSADTPLTPNLQVFVIHKGTLIQTVQQTIPTPIQTVLDNSLSFGTSAIRQQGSPGTQVLTYQVATQNSVVTSRTLIQTVVIQPPVPEIIAEGQAVQIPSDKEAVMAQAGISSGDYPYVNYIVSNESGWCPTKLQGQVGYCPGYAPASIPSYLGYGLVQATPGDKMSSAGSDWETNPVTQLIWASGYAQRYGGWAGAYDFWYSHHYW